MRCEGIGPPPLRYGTLVLWFWRHVDFIYFIVFHGHCYDCILKYYKLYLLYSDCELWSTSGDAFSAHIIVTVIILYIPNITWSTFSLRLTMYAVYHRRKKMNKYWRMCRATAVAAVHKSFIIDSVGACLINFHNHGGGHLSSCLVIIYKSRYL